MADAAPAVEEQPAAPEGGFRGGFGERGRGRGRRGRGESTYDASIMMEYLY